MRKMQTEHEEKTGEEPGREDKAWKQKEKVKLMLCEAGRIPIGDEEDGKEAALKYSDSRAR